MKASNGWKVPDFYRLSGEDNKIREHISMFLAQLGEASTMEHMSIQNFSLSLTGTLHCNFALLVLGHTIIRSFVNNF